MNHPTTRAAVATHAFPRALYAGALTLGTLAVAAFGQATLGQFHGLASLVVLGLASIALVLWGGPLRTARVVAVSDAPSAALVVRRYTAVRTVVPLVELVDAHVVDDGLLLVPADADAFYDTHAELREVATPVGALIPLGRRRGVTERVTALLPR